MQYGTAPNTRAPNTNGVRNPNDVHIPRQMRNPNGVRNPNNNRIQKNITAGRPPAPQWFRTTSPNVYGW